VCRSHDPGSGRVLPDLPDPIGEFPKSAFPLKGARRAGNDRVGVAVSTPKSAAEKLEADFRPRAGAVARLGELGRAERTGAAQRRGSGA
jgi:hypothetical protein